MPESTTETRVQITGDSSGLQKALGKAGAATGKLDSTVVKLGKTSAGAFAAMAGGVALAVRKFADFEASFTNVQTLLDDSSFATGTLQEGVEGLKNGILALGIETGQSFETLNKGLFDLVSAGVPAGDALSALTVATDLALAGATDTSVAVDGLTTALNAFGISADNSRQVAEKFFTAQKFGKTTIEELSTNMGKAAAIASSTGVSFDELLGAVSAATLGGIQTEAAFTSLKALLSNIQKPTKDAADEAARLGVKFDSTSLRSQGLKKFLDEVTGSAGFNATSLEKLFGSTEALGLALSLTGGQAEEFNNILGALGDQSQTSANFSAALATKQQTAQVAFDKLSRSVESIAIVLGAEFAPMVLDVANAVGKMAKAITGMDGDTKKSITSAAKWAIQLAGTGAAAAVVLKAVALMRAGLIGFGTVLTATKIKAIATWGAVTLGLNLAVLAATELTARWIANEEDKADGTEEAAQRIKETSEANIKALEEAQANYQESDETAQADHHAAKEEELTRHQEEVQTKTDDHLALQTETARQARETDLAFQKEYNQLSEEERARFTTQEKQDLLAARATNESLEKEGAKIRIQNQNDENRRRLEAQRLFSGKMTSITELMQSSMWNTTKEGMDEIAKLSKSKNKTLKEIGKTAALAQLAMDTVQGATKAFNALAWIPVVGVGLGAVAAAAVVAYGAEQAGAIQKMQDGGRVPHKPGGGRDRVPALLEPGEFVVPKSQADVVEGFLRSAHRMQKGGRVPEEPNKLQKNFWDMLDPIQMIKNVLNGNPPGGDPAGFGAELINEVPGAILGALMDAAQALLDMMGGDLQNAIAAIDSVREGLSAAASNAVSNAQSVHQQGIDVVTGAAGNIAHSLGFQAGGIVPPTSGGMTDRVEAVLAPGEGVLTARTMNEILQGQRVIGAQKVMVELALKDDLGRIVRAEIRELDRLGV